MESSVAIAIGAISEVVVWCSPDSGSGGVVTSIKVSSSLVAGSVSHVADSSSVSSSVTISVVVVGVVTGEVVREGVVGGVAVIDGVVVGAAVGEVASVVTTVVVVVSEDVGLDLSRCTSGDLGGCLDLGTVGGDSKKCGGESFHCEF